MADETPTSPEPTSPAPEPAPAPATPSDGTARKSRKVREGVVVSASSQKTVVVAVTERVQHRRYGKTVRRTKKLHAHDDTDGLRVGDKVQVAECRPLSKLKRWRVVEVLERAR